MPRASRSASKYLCRDQGDERISLFYKQGLERLGVNASVRTVDDVQYQNRIRSFDFDLTTTLWAQSLSPGNEQRDFLARRPPIIPAAGTCPASRTRRSMR